MRKAAAWGKANGPKASQGTFADGARLGEMFFNCTSGVASVDALKLAGAANLNGKVLLDIANPLDFSKGMPPTLSVCNAESLGEEIQRAFPDVKVVKALNTMNCKNHGESLPGAGEYDVFVSGNDPGRQGQGHRVLKDWFGWKSVIDLGDITTARGTEQLLALWVRLMGTLGTANLISRS